MTCTKREKRWERRHFVGHTLQLRPSPENVDGNVVDHVQNGILKRGRTPEGPVNSQSGSNDPTALVSGAGEPTFSGTNQIL